MNDVLQRLIILTKAKRSNLVQSFQFKTNGILTNPINNNLVKASIPSK